MPPAFDILLALVGQAAIVSAIVRNTPRFLEQYYALRAIIEAQPSPAIWYLQLWHNR
jgi:hypothetical protein